jgi:predicted CXXCH cytochrome family protein
MTKGCHQVSFRSKLTVRGLLSFLLVSGFFAGCYEKNSVDAHIVHSDKATFHKVLTLIFDGVPPLDYETTEVGTENIDPNVPDVRKRPEVDWCIHAPLKDCVRCHGNRQQESFSREVQLIARIPELCYQCHEGLELKSFKGWVHGPVAAGQCLVCHEPHKTKIPHLLREQIPVLCYNCHQEIAGELTPDNVKESHSQCMSCHSPHAGSARYATDRIPQLCYECHESLMPTVLKDWVHGPVAVGQCLLCHDLHKTESQHLLREEIPALCYLCHEETFVKSINDHWKESYVDCNKCHEGHMSPEQYLLRPDRQRKSGEVEVKESVSGASGAIR